MTASTPVIPTKSNERRNPRFDRAAYRQRNRIERLINQLKQSRRIATRYEKRAVNYHAMITYWHDQALALPFADTP